MSDLTEVYTSKTDDELLALAAEQDTLLPEARHILRDELRRRKLPDPRGHAERSRKETRKEKRLSLSAYQHDLLQRQKNLTPPDILRNDGVLDSFMFNGSPDATPLQRVGILLFALPFFCIVIVFVRGVLSRGRPPAILAILLCVLVAPFLALGVKLVRAALRTK